MAALDHVNVVVADMERSIAFYRTLLNLAVVMDRVLDGDWFERLTGIAGARARCVILDAPDGGCRIELLAYEGRAAPALSANSRPDTGGLRHVAVRVACLDTALAALPATAEIIEVPRDIVKSGKRMAYVRDPDGAIVELAEYGAAKPEFC